MIQLKIPHRKAPYRCPVNGLCDVYEWKTGQRIPEALIFDSRIGFKMIYRPLEPIPVLVYWGEGGIGKSEYEFWQDKIGYRMHVLEGRDFDSTIQYAKELIDEGIPVILYGLDMYHLPYHPQFYHKIHIQGHVNLMVGYNGNTLYVHDNDREGIQEIQADDLALAWEGGYQGFGAINSVFGIDMYSPNPSVKEMVAEGFCQTAEAYLNSKAGFLGLEGCQNLAAEIGSWPKQFGKPVLRGIGEHLTTFTASTVPELPRSLRAYDTGVVNPHRGCRDSLAAALLLHGGQLGEPCWQDAARYCEKSGEGIERLTQCIAQCILEDDYRPSKDAPRIVEEIFINDELAFRQWMP